MAQNKKVFSIVINGITENVEAVKSLNTQLDDLEDRIKRLQNAKIDIKVSGGKLDNKKEKVSGGKSGVDVEAKLTKQLETEKAKAVALTNEEYKKQLQELNQIKAANKDIQDTQKDIAKGVLDANGNYANTLAGQRALLGDLKKQLANTELGTEGWEELGKKVLQVNENVKKLEESYGVFTRSVGNYEKAAKGFKDLADGTREYQNSIAGLTQKIADLTDKLSELEGGTDEFKNMAADITEAKLALSELEAATDTAGNAMENKLGIKFTTTINGIEYAFDDVNQGVGLLEDKLYQLANAGKQNSKEFKAIQAEIVRLKNVVIQTDTAIDGMIGTSKGLRGIMSIVAGFTGIASIGQGISALFGGENKDLDEAIQKFAGLSLIMQGIESVQKEMMNTSSVFGKFMVQSWGAIGKVVDTVGNKFAKLPIAKQINDAIDAVKEIEKRNGLEQRFDEIGKSVMKLVDSSSELKAIYDKLSDAEKRNIGLVSTLDTKEAEEIGEISDGLKEFYDKFQDIIKENPKLQEQFVKIKKEFKDTSIEFTKAAIRYSALGKKGRVLASTLPKVAKGFKLVTTAIKALAKSTVILAVIQFAIEAIVKLFEVLGNEWDKWTGQNDIMIDGAETLANKLEKQGKMWKELNDQMERSEKLGNSSVFTKLDTQIYLMNMQLEELGKQMKDFIGDIEDLQKEADLDAGNGFLSVGFKNDIQTMTEFRSEYDILLKAISEGKDRVEAGGEGWGWWNTEQDAMEDFVNMQREAIKIMAQSLQEIDFSKPEEAIKQFTEIMDDELYSSAFANIDEVFPDEAWAKTLKLMVERYQKAIDEMKGLNEGLEDANAEAQKQITKNTIAAIKDRHKREKAELDQQRKDELDAAAGNENLKQSILDKYRLKEIELEKRQAAELRKVRETIEANYIAAMKDGLDKRIKELEHSRQVEIASARDSEMLVNEQIASINAKYNKLIADAKYDFYKDLEEKTKERNQILIDLEIEYSKQLEDIQNQINQKILDNKKIVQEISDIDIASNITYDPSDFDSIRKYYEKIEQLKIESLNNRIKLEKEQSVLEGNIEKKNENRRYEEQKKIIQKNFEDKQRLFDELLRNGEINQKDYNEKIKNLNSISNNQLEMLDEQHGQMLEQIQSNTENNLTKIVKEGNEERKNIAATTANEISSAYQEILSSDKVNIDIDDEKYKNQFGFIKAPQLKKDLKDAQSILKDGMDNINQQMLDNKAKFDKGEISFVDFNETQKNLENMKESTGKTLSDVDKNLKNFGMSVAQNIAGTISNYMQQIGSVFSMFNDVMMQEYENQQAELDRQKEILSEEENQLEEHYQKQQEITKKYTDKINGIEDELKDARGERRQHLLDMLAAQTDGQLQSLAKEKEIEKEKEENEKKQEALAKKQDALDKKRKQQEKLNSIVQATINTSVAVTNALAVQPWFVGVALAATAAALGIAQIAKIKAAKYANGGVINGKSHAQGGVPVLGGRAEVEGGEFITNKETTDNNKDLLYYTNSIKRPITLDDMEKFYSQKNKVVVPKSSMYFADGGELPEMYDINIKKAINSGVQQDNRPIVVSVVDIVNKSDNLREVKTLAGL